MLVGVDECQRIFQHGARELIVQKLKAHASSVGSTVSQPDEEKE